MRTRTIGEILKEERIKHRLRLEDLSKKTRIRVDYLKSLEENKFKELPSATFVKGYIKTYAQVFGFDHEPIIALLRRDYKESAVGKLVPREFIKPVIKRRVKKTSVTVVLVALVVVFLSLVGYIGVQWHNLNKPPSLEIIVPREQAMVSSKVVVEGKTLQDAVVTVNDQPVALHPDGSFRTEIIIPNEGISLITVQARDRRGKVNTTERSVTVQF
jgi:cytoskeletal protein RodZ